MFPFSSDRSRQVARRVSREIARARRQRRHVYVNDWLFPPRSAPKEIVQALLEWCRETASQCRRPFGIDGFDLAVAVGRPQRPISSVAFDRIKPMAFYETAVSGRLVGLLYSIEREFRPGEDVRMSAALFSWGDAAHAALPPTPNQEGIRA